MNSDIKTFRRFVLALISILFFGLAASSLAQGQVKLVKSLYRVQLTGIYVHDWHGQSEDYPRSDRGWQTERGTITSGFHTKGRGILYRGMKLEGKLPAGMQKTPFQFYPLAGVRAKANNRQQITIRRNYVPACGGELGECDGTEPSGVKTTSKKCGKPNAVLPFALDYDDKPELMELDFLFHPSNYDFCGKKYPYFASITDLPDRRRVGGGATLIEKLKPGRKQVWRYSKEFGEIVSRSTGWAAQETKTCPPMSGHGSQSCWTVDLRLEVKRIK